MCPYSLDVPGGVQGHVGELAEHLIAAGHEVRVLAPADDGAELPGHVDTVGGAVPVPYNGSVARLVFGPVAAVRVRRWVADGGFDVLHLHEPLAPSVSLLALWAATGPIVATWHSAQLRSRAMQLAQPLSGPTLEKVSAHIAVSEDARRTLVDHLGGDAVVVPNGVDVARFARAAPRPEWAGAPGAPTLAFLGRYEEPRKGLDVLLAALPAVRAAHPGVRLLVAGRGDPAQVLARAGASAGAVEVLGPLDEADKASLLASVDAYVAPQTGGESFGIVLVEAMAAGTPVVASDLPAFRRVLDGGRLGALAGVGDAGSLAAAVRGVLADPAGARRVAGWAAEAVRRYDWSRVAGQVQAVYETVRAGIPGGGAAAAGAGAGAAPGAPPAAGPAPAVGEDERARRLLARWRLP